MDDPHFEIISIQCRPSSLCALVFVRPFKFSVSNKGKDIQRNSVDFGLEGSWRCYIFQMNMMASSAIVGPRLSSQRSFAVNGHLVRTKISNSCPDFERPGQNFRSVSGLCERPSKKSGNGLIW